MSNAIYNEYALAGAIFSLVEDHGVAPAIKHVMQVDAADFTDNFVGSMYAVMKASIIDDQAFDLITVCESLQAQYGHDNSVIADVGRLVKDNRSYSAIESHKRAVKTAAIKRLAMQSLLDSYHEMEQTDDPVKTLGRLESKVEAMMGYSSNEKSGFTHLGDLMMQWVNDADDIIQGKQKEPGFTSGIDAVNDLLGEKLLLPGSLFVIGANPGAGKTGLMVKMADGMARQSPQDQVLIYSLEMPNSQIADRFAGLHTDNTNPKFFDTVHWGKLSDALELYKRSNIYCCDNSVVNVSNIKADCRERAQNGKIACIMVDYLTLMEMPKKDRNDLSVGEVTKQLKRLAKELGCVVILLCQLSRANMQRANKRPIKSDLRDSGQIEQDADYILFPYRDAQFYPDSPAGIYAELILDKNRHGSTGTVYAAFKNGTWQDCEQAQANHHCRMENS